MVEENSIFKKLSPTSMSKNDSAVVCRLYDEVLQGKDIKKPSIKEIASHRGQIATSAQYAKEIIAETTTASFKYLNDIQKLALSRKLKWAYYILSAQYQLDEAEHRKHQAPKNAEAIYQCAMLVRLLDIQKEKTDKELLSASTYSPKHLKYLGLKNIAPFMTTKIEEFSSGKTVVLKQWMGDFNARRLYWVWGGGLLSSIIALLPDNFGNKGQAMHALDSPTMPLGYISWILYYTKAGINIGLLLKHTLKGPWMSKEEQQLSTAERFKTQWNQRKFAILNDFVWATINLITFFWLTGRGMMGYAGDVLTTVLLLFDMSLNIWRFHEEQTKHNKLLEDLNKEIASLESIRIKYKERKKTRENAQKIVVLEEEQRKLRRRIRQAEIDWKFDKFKLINDLAYGISLVGAFSVVCSMLIPPTVLAPLTMQIFGFVGSAMCFTLTLLYSAVNGVIEVSRAKTKQKDAIKECRELINKFKSDECTGYNARRLLFLEMKQLVATSEYQRKQANFALAQMVRSILVDALVPMLVFTAVLFMPLGFGIGMLGVGLGLAIASHLLINRFQPQKNKIDNFDDKEFDEFKKDPSIEKLIDAEKKYDPRKFVGTGSKAKSENVDTDEAVDSLSPTAVIEPTVD